MNNFKSKSLLTDDVINGKPTPKSSKCFQKFSESFKLLSEMKNVDTKAINESFLSTLEKQTKNLH